METVRLIGLVYTIEKFHKAVADHSVDGGGDESILLAAECHTQIMPTVMSDLSKGRHVHANGNIVKDLFRKHTKIMRSANGAIASIPQLVDVAKTIAELAKVDLFSDTVPAPVPSTKYKRPADPPDDLRPRNEIHRSPFMVRPK
jgi:hypothetical protein